MLIFTEETENLLLNWSFYSHRACAITATPMVAWAVSMEAVAMAVAMAGTDVASAAHHAVADIGPVVSIEKLLESLI